MKCIERSKKKKSCSKFFHVINFDVLLCEAREKEEEKNTYNSIDGIKILKKGLLLFIFQDVVVLLIVYYYYNGFLISRDHSVLIWIEFLRESLLIFHEVGVFWRILFRFILVWSAGRAFSGFDWSFLGFTGWWIGISFIKSVLKKNLDSQPPSYFFSEFELRIFVRLS